jgi:bacillopeptidase F (M6 metalloprotease family)
MQAESFPDIANVDEGQDVVDYYRTKCQSLQHYIKYLKKVESRLTTPEDKAGVKEALDDIVKKFTLNFKKLDIIQKVLIQEKSKGQGAQGVQKADMEIEDILSTALHPDAGIVGVKKMEAPIPVKNKFLGK